MELGLRLADEGLEGIEGFFVLRGAKDLELLNLIFCVLRNLPELFWDTFL